MSEWCEGYVKNIERSVGKRKKELGEPRGEVSSPDDRDNPTGLRASK